MQSTNDKNQNSPVTLRSGEEKYFCAENLLNMQQNSLMIKIQETPTVCMHFFCTLFCTLGDISNLFLKIPECHNNFMELDVLAHDSPYNLALEKKIVFLVL